MGVTCSGRSITLDRLAYVQGRGADQPAGVWQLQHHPCAFWFSRSIERLLAIGRPLQNGTTGRQLVWYKGRRRGGRCGQPFRRYRKVECHRLQDSVWESKLGGNHNRRPFCFSGVHLGRGEHTRAVVKWGHGKHNELPMVKPKNRGWLSINGSSEELSYAAGMLDGDGCISVNKWQLFKKGGGRSYMVTSHHLKTPRYSLVVCSAVWRQGENYGKSKNRSQLEAEDECSLPCSDGN